MVTENYQKRLSQEEIAAELRNELSPVPESFILNGEYLIEILSNSFFKWQEAIEKRVRDEMLKGSLN